MAPVPPRGLPESSAKLRRTRAAVVCVDGGDLLSVRLRDPVSGVARLFVPGGEIEPGEAPAAAAAREAREETGYAVDVDVGSERVIRYPFVWAGRAVDCTTHFFRAALVTPRERPARASAEPIQVAVEWLPLERLDDALGFHAEILATVRMLAR